MSNSGENVAEPNPPTEPQLTEKQSATAAASEDFKTPEKLQVAAVNESQGQLVPTVEGQEERMLPHVERAYRSSETRTPIIAAMSDGDPYYTVSTLARREGCAVWSIVMGTEKNEQNALDYVEVGTQNGDWVYLTNVERGSQEVLRQIALTLYTLKPEPKQFPRRHLFRLVLVTDTPIEVNDLIRPILPQAMVQHALVARAKPPGMSSSSASMSPVKIQRRLPAELPLFEQAVNKRAQRRQIGRESDSESDADEPEKKATGMWFYRSVDFYETDGGSTVARVNEVIFEAVDKEDTRTITELANSGRLNIDAVEREGMNPLMTAVSHGKEQSVKALLEAGADVHVRRKGDNCPLLFMCIESEEIVSSLIAAGANIDERFEGYRLETHPTTMPHIAAMIRDLKGIPPVKTSALELAAQLTAASEKQAIE